MIIFIIKCLFLPIKFAELFISKNENTWVFGSWMGESFSDNTKELFLFTANKRGEIRPIWLTKNKNVIRELRANNYEAYHFFSIKGIYYSINAGVAVMSTSWIDLPVITFLFSRKTKYIQLWHGTPLKLFDLKKGTLLKRALRFVLIAHMGREYDSVISAANSNRHITFYSKQFNITKDKIKILGQPRNDVLFSSSVVHNKVFGENKFDKIILHMPTWRPYDFDILASLNLKEFNKFLAASNMLFVFKLHPNDIKKYAYEFNYSNIVNITNADLYSYLQHVDLLITDYSGIYFDFLMLNRPIIFAAFDKDEYLSENGLLYNYDEVTPGQHVSNWAELQGVLTEVLIENKDKYINERININKKFNAYLDGNSSNRVFEYIYSIR